LPHEYASKPVLGGLPTHLMPSSNYQPYICMITHYSLHGYITICLLHLEYSFILCLPFILEVGLNVCHTILNPIIAYPCIEYWSGIQSCYPIHIHARLLTPCLPLQKYK
jgi:hypothetical protein